MLLKNYFNWRWNFGYSFSSLLGTQSRQWKHDVNDLGLTYISSDSSDSKSYILMSYDGLSNLTCASKGYVFNSRLVPFVGSSNTEVTFNDTDLGNYLSDISCSIVSITYSNEETNTIKTLYVITATNNGSDTVDIKEVGIAKQFYAFASASSSAQEGWARRYLMIRELLANPISLPVGKTCRIEVEMTDAMAFN